MPAQRKDPRPTRDRVELKPTHRRSHRRVRQWLQVRLDPGKIHTVTGDLGPGGAFVHTDRSLSPGAPVRIVIELPDNSVAVAEGVVRWTKPATAPGGSSSQAGLGVEFTRVSDELEAYLNEGCPFILQAV